jgi:hypothetical protein
VSCGFREALLEGRITPTGWNTSPIPGEFFAATAPLWKVALERPHYRIVERQANTLLDPGSVRSSEDLSILNPIR